jgi:tRNA A37 threonylcarbamoyladenosine dehydratase
MSDSRSAKTPAGRLTRIADLYGVGRLRLCDFDRITASSLNRHPTAGPADVGRFKADLTAETIRTTCPDTDVEERRDFVDAETASRVLDPPADHAVDAIDSLGPKVALLPPDLTDIGLARGRRRNRQPSASCTTR